MNFGTDCLCSCNSVKVLMTDFSIPLELHNPIVNLSLVPKLSSELALHGLCMGSAHTKGLHTGALLVKKVFPYRAHLPVLHTGLLHYATKERRTEAQVNVPDVPVPAEDLQHERVLRDSQSEMSTELCAAKAVNTTQKSFPIVLGLVLKPFLHAAREFILAKLRGLYSCHDSPSLSRAK